MRIISGKFKGKKLFLPKDKKTRPLKDITKESIFNLITHSKKINFEFKNSNILDLFSGSGSFGLECFSRECEHVTFVESYKPALDVLEKNIKSLNINKNYEIIKKDIYKENFFSSINKNYNLIFFDPPFKDNKIQYLLSLIYENKILKKKGFIIFHRHKKVQDIIHKKFEIIESRIYGISNICFLKLK